MATTSWQTFLPALSLLSSQTLDIRIITTVHRGCGQGPLGLTRNLDTTAASVLVFCNDTFILFWQDHNDNRGRSCWKKDGAQADCDQQQNHLAYFRTLGWKTYGLCLLNAVNLEYRISLEFFCKHFHISAVTTKEWRMLNNIFLLPPCKSLTFKTVAKEETTLIQGIRSKGRWFINGKFSTF